jgi:hypothetical protein
MNIAYAYFMYVSHSFGDVIGYKTDMTEIRNAGDYSVTYIIISVALIVFFILLHTFKVYTKADSPLPSGAKKEGKYYVPT